MAARVISCRWDWCRFTSPSTEALDAHVKCEHIWPMKPMRKAEIALMRRMDLQSLHSSPGTDLNIISRGLIVGVSRCKTPPALSSTSAPRSRKRSENEEPDTFDRFAQLSSPPKVHSPQRLRASPALEGLIRQDGHSGLSAAVEMFERMHGHKTNQHLRFPSHQRSPMRFPDSQSPGSSQEAVEQQLTQEDYVGSQPPPPPEPPIEDELTDNNLRWPIDDELDVSATEETWNSEQSVPKQNYGTSSDSSQNFRCALGVNIYTTGSPSSSQPHTSQGSHSSSQPFVLQTQAPYSSQATGWSQT